MKHFDINEWVDFVRGLSPAADREQMQTHLSSGCLRCQRVADLLRRLAATAANETRYQVPRYAEHSVQSIFVLRQPEKVRILPRIAARLVYDSYLDPLPAGVRTLQRFSHQVLYQAGDFSLDLRLEHEHGSRLVSLVGQIANRKEPGARLASVPVFLMSGKEIVSKATTSPFGEFQMEYEPKSKLRLYAAVNDDGGKRIDLPVHRPTSTSSGRGKDSLKESPGSKTGRKRR